MSRFWRDAIGVVTGARMVIDAAITSKRTSRWTQHTTKQNIQIRKDPLPETRKTPLRPNKIKMTESPNSLQDKAAPRKVPSSRTMRAMHVGGLMAGMGMGAVSEMVRRSFGGGEPDRPAAMNSKNMQRITDTMSRMRGAALKLGQMFSMQDENLVSPAFAQTLERVRNNADFMPFFQVEEIMVRDFGENWRDNFTSFEELPLAAASIGQVHSAVYKNGDKVAVKVQYPGVRESITSDIDNIASLLSLSSMLPKGAHINKSLANAKKELTWECDYIREGKYQQQFRELLEDEEVFKVPKLYGEASSESVITSEFIHGLPVDKLTTLPQEVRDWVGYNILKLCLKEIFLFNTMQTDPNWTNFFYNTETNQIGLLDFGASREFDPSFIDTYFKVIKAAINRDKESVIKHSITLGFLTGEETKIMNDAHCGAVVVLGDPFATEGNYDFGQQTVTKQVKDLIPTMLKHRLTPPPEETYSLHRKLSGCFLICSKLKANIPCKDMWLDIVEQYTSKNKT